MKSHAAHLIVLATLWSLAAAALGDEKDEKIRALEKQVAELKAEVEALKRQSPNVMNRQKGGFNVNGNVTVVGSGNGNITSRTALTGSGKAATKAWPTPGVTGVELAVGGVLTAVVGDKDELQITADDNILPAFEPTVKDGTLTIAVKSGQAFTTQLQLTYQLTVRKPLKAISLTAGGDAALDGQVVADQFAAVLSGSGDLTLANAACKSLGLTLSGSGHVKADGTAATVTATLSGSGGLTATGLKAGAVIATLTGSGQASVWAATTLEATLTGSGDLTYKGDPTVTQSATGSGRVKSAGK